MIEHHAHDVDWRAELVLEDPPIIDGFFPLNDRPVHGKTLDEEMAREHLKAGTSVFGDSTHA